jgi:hypothetical protein
LPRSLASRAGVTSGLAGISRVCSTLVRAAKGGTGRSWISHEYAYEEDDSFDDDTGYDPDT